MKPRFAVGLTLLALAVAAWVLTIGFDLNGPQYNAWVSSCGLLAVTLLLVGLGAFVAVPWEPSPRAVGRRAVTTALAGLVVFGICLAITFTRFHDGYTGSLVWPDLAAWVGTAAFLAAVFTLLKATTPARRGHAEGGAR
jgi:uncharacterized membrane protein YhaH (DUF805 family)